MAIDLNEAIRAAMERKDAWDISAFRETLDELSNVERNLEVDWDEAAGEEVGRILHGGQVKALLFQLMPMLLAHNSILDRVAGLSNIETLEVRPFNDYNNEEFKWDIPNTRVLTGKDIYALNDSKLFSAGQIYYYFVG
ncbi:hypothetical protein NKH84_29020 [Mesorhizobium sp. M0902]|uniref:hypothetical protein n=1 Tax=unclassified Mesorhizobium TaxID=325217 RepID=UPI003337D23A